MKIYYLWNFKPGETNKVPQKMLDNNKKYIDCYEIITKKDFETILEKENLFQEFPKLQQLISRIPKWIILTDLARLVLIYTYGGLYCDIDCIIRKPIPFQDNRDKVYVFEEKIVMDTRMLGPREKKTDMYKLRIANYCFGTTIKKHEFFKEVIEECILRLEKLLQEYGNRDDEWTQHDILWCCGPDVITTLYHEKENKNIFHLFDKSHLQHLCLSSWREKRK